MCRCFELPIANPYNIYRTFNSKTLTLDNIFLNFSDMICNTQIIIGGTLLIMILQHCNRIRFPASYGIQGSYQIILAI